MDKILFEGIKEVREERFKKYLRNDEEWLD